MASPGWIPPIAPPFLEHRQADSGPADLGTTVLLGSSAFLASVAMNMLFLGTDPAEPRACPRGWEDGGSVGLGCVWAEAKGSGINQTEANALCQEKDPGARLVEIYSQEQQDFLVKYMTRVEAIADLDSCDYDYDYYDYYYYDYYYESRNCYRTYNWWIGLEKSSNTGDFYWISGSPLNFTAWSSGDNRCVQAFSAKHSDLAWYNYNCGDTYNVYPLCQITAAALLTTQPHTATSATSRTVWRPRLSPTTNVKRKPKPGKLGAKRRKSSKSKSRNKSRSGRAMKEAVRIQWKQ